MRMRKVLAAGVAALAMLVASTPARAADVPESSDPIRIAINEWTGTQILSYIVGDILERMGYNVEYVTAGMFPTHIATGQGELHLFMETFETNMGEYLPSLLEEGKVEDLGSSGIKGFEGWMYPAHVEDICPGLPAWDAFLGCAEQFASAETHPKGRIVSFPAEWGQKVKEIVAERNLPFEYIPAGSEGSLIAELKTAVARKSALMMEWASPHWTHAQYDTRWVEMPEDIEEKWGYGNARVFKAGWPGIATKWPAAHKVLKSFNFDNKTQEKLSGAIDVDGKDAREACKQWVDENEAVWKPWVDQATM